MINWTSTIPTGASLDSVKKNQPDFIEIDWDSPMVIDSVKNYLITKIKNNNDPLRMVNYISFINDKYQGRFAHK